MSYSGYCYCSYPSDLTGQFTNTNLNSCYWHVFPVRRASPSLLLPLHSALIARTNAWHRARTLQTCRCVPAYLPSPSFQHYLFSLHLRCTHTDRCDFHGRVFERWFGLEHDVSKQRADESHHRRVRVRLQPVSEQRRLLQLWLQLCVRLPAVLQRTDVCHR